jgi:hypothetical protein
MKAVGAHLLLAVAAAAAVCIASAHFAYGPLRVALIALVVVLSAVMVAGRFPLALGPVAESATARIVRLIGTALAGIGAAGVVLGLAQGASLSERARSGVPIYTVVLAVYFAAFLAVTRRDGGLPPRAMSTSVGLGLLAAAVFAAAVPLLRSGIIWLAYLLIAAAATAAGQLARPRRAALPSAVFTAAVAAQAVFFVAAALYRYGPAAWVPYAGPGPLTAQEQVAQNRAEAIDPYVGPLLLGAIAAALATGMALGARRRARAAGAAPLTAA